MKIRTIKIIISSILFLIAIVTPYPISPILYMISYLIVGCEIITKALKNLIRGNVLDENFLMSTATIGAFILKEYPEAVSVMLFYQIGELFQSYAIDKSRKSIKNLMDIKPDYANLYQENQIQRVNPEVVNVDDIILIRPGEKVPLDGTVIEGTTMIDTHAITGEPIPRKEAQLMKY